MNTVYFSTGSNLGNKVKYLNSAKTGLGSQIGKVIAASSIYKSAPWGFSHQSYFLNQVLVCETDLSALAVLEKIRQIEKNNHRERNENGYAARTLDIDILFYENRIINTRELTIPHPLLHTRSFVLLPMNEIAPDYIHPVLKKPIRELLGECDDKTEIEIYQDSST